MTTMDEHRQCKICGAQLKFARRGAPIMYLDVCSQKSRSKAKHLANMAARRAKKEKKTDNTDWVLLHLKKDEERESCQEH